MRAVCEFRVDEEFAPRLFTATEGKRLGDTVRKVQLATDDPRFDRIGELQRETRMTAGRPFFYGWNIHHLYSKAELLAAGCFRLKVSKTFEPAGEQCGTRYDESRACPGCGAGALQESDLRLDLRRVPRRGDIARTIAGETIVSQRLAERMINAQLSGFELRPVRHKARYEDEPIDLRKVPTGLEILHRAEAVGTPHPSWGFWVWLNRGENRALLEQTRVEYAASKEAAGHRRREPTPVWHQLVVRYSQADIVPPTRVGINPFDDDPKGECRCPLGHLLGLNLLSEVFVRAATRGEADFICSRQFIGVRRGLLRPERIILISPKVRDLLQSERVKGYEIEVAHLR